MKLAIRIVMLVFVTVPTYYFVYWLPFSLVLPPGRYLWIRFLGSVLCAVIAGYCVWKFTSPSNQADGHSSRGGVPFILMSALITGAISFAAGFFGPIIFEPGANQGPLLGIFVTGPLGFVVGGIGGAVYWAFKARR